MYRPGKAASRLTWKSRETRSPKYLLNSYEILYIILNIQNKYTCTVLQFS